MNIVKILKNKNVATIYLVILFSGVTLYVALNFGEVSQYLSDIISVKILLAIIPYTIVVAIINPVIHSIAYRNIGANISVWSCFKIFHLSRIGNYIPGRVWFALNYYIFSRLLNIEKHKIANNFIVLNVILLITGALCSLSVVAQFGTYYVVLLFILLFFAVFSIHPKILNRFVTLVTKEHIQRNYDFHVLAKISLLYIISYVLTGISIYICLTIFGAVGMGSFHICVSAAASSIILGLLFIFAPAGIGVMEGVSISIPGSIVSWEVAISRIIH